MLVSWRPQDHVGIALQSLPIVSLKVGIKCVSQFGPEPDPLKWPPLPECDSPKKPDLYCYVLDAMSEEDVQGRLRYFLEKTPTLRQAAIAWGRCFLATPHRVVAVDLDNVPHTVDRPGLPADAFWEDHYRRAAIPASSRWPEASHPTSSDGAIIKILI